MQVSKKVSLFLFLFMVNAGGVSAQVIRNNEKGEKIVVYPDGRWRYFDKSQSGQDYPVVQSSIDPLDNPVFFNEDDARKIVNRRAQLAREASSIAQTRVEEASQQRSRIEQELSQSISNHGQQSDPVKRLNLRLSAAKKTELEAIQEAQLAQEVLASAEELTRKGNILQEFKKTQVNRASQVNLPKVENLALDFFPALNAMAGYYADWNIPAAAKSTPNTCRYAFNGIDENSGRWRRDQEKQLLFTYTDDRLRLFLKDKEYLRCEGFLSSVDGFRFLSLEFTFAYPNAREAYGFIEKGSILTIKLLNGQFVNLQAGTLDRGSYDTRRELLTYRVQYPVDQSLISFLRSSEAEAIRVFWSSGYEEYPVSSLDFFIRQIDCLEKPN